MEAWGPLQHAQCPQVTIKLATILVFNISASLAAEISCGANDCRALDVPSSCWERNREEEEEEEEEDEIDGARCIRIAKTNGTQ